MKSFIKKITKPLAIGVFFMALFFNVKVSLENPFIHLSGEVLAQTSSSSSSSSSTKYCFNCIGTEGTCFTINGSPGPKGKIDGSPEPCPD